MRWYSNQKVRLALIVNGIYFISHFTAPSPPHARPHLFATARATRAERAPKRAPVFAPLPPPSGPSTAATWVNKEFDQLDVYLTNDLTLVRRPGRLLQLSPAFTTSASSREAPESVLLRFVSFADEQTFLKESPVSITADGNNMWEQGASYRYGGDASRTVATGSDGERVVETLGINLPYEVFVETISARQVIIQVGSDRVELTAEQIEALRDMHRRLPQPPPPDNLNSR